MLVNYPVTNGGKMDNKEIGQKLLEHAKTEGATVRGALQDLFPYIYGVSNRMSKRKISEWLEEKHGVRISFSSIAKALQKPDPYIQETAMKFYGQAKALDYYIPKTEEFNSLDVLASRSLLNVLKAEEPLNDALGIVKGILEGLEDGWFSLPEKYRDVCLAAMREHQKQQQERGNKNADTAEG
jgi:hypothetical protein